MLSVNLYNLMILLVIICFQGVAITSSWANQVETQAFLSELSIPPQRHIFTHFYSPNELFPGLAIPHFNRAPKGVHIAVGTERAFIGAALNKSATHLIAIDADKNAVMFNHINIALLKASTSKEDLAYLRNEADELEVLIRLTPYRDLMAPEEVSHVFDYNNIQWFRNIMNSTHHERFNNSINHSHFGEVPFENANYLFDDKLYKRLKSLADNNKMMALHFNLKDIKAIRSLSLLLKEKQLPLSMLDLSNTWNHLYLGSLGVWEVLKAFETSSQKSTVILITKGNIKLTWEYFAFLWEDALEAFKVDNILDDPQFCRSLLMEGN